MRQPLPVDVIPNWWDYVVDGVGIVSGLATAGALIYAARTYRRQVNEAIRRQAAQVGLSLEPLNDGREANVWVDNTSDQPIDIRSCSVILAANGADVPRASEAAPDEAKYPYRFGMHAHQKRELMRITMPDDDEVLGWIDFKDESGKLWVRYVDGALEYDEDNSFKYRLTGCGQGYATLANAKMGVVGESSSTNYGDVVALGRSAIHFARFRLRRGLLLALQHLLDPAADERVVVGHVGD